MKLLNDYLDRSPLADFMIKKMGMIGIAVFAAYCVYTNHNSLKRIEDTILMNNVEVEERYFPDPSGLSTEIYINERGRKEVYLVHEKSGLKRPILFDLGSTTNQLIESLENRIDSMDKEKAKYSLNKIYIIQKELYEKIIE